MSKHIVAGMEWTEEEIKTLPVEKGFRMRGLETTRLDTLVDAGFAFVLSFLAISQDELPSSFSELVWGVKTIPALILSFFMLILFWLEHRRWSRRYGIETNLSIFLSISLVFVLLIYIFPLRLLFESMYGFLTAGYLPFNFVLNSESDARHFFALYSVGFCVMSILVAGLYQVALKKKNRLLLDVNEYRVTVSSYIKWLLSMLFAIVSLCLAYLLPISQIHWAGFVYFGLPLVLLINYFVLIKGAKKPAI